jgi:hypothetical protein
MPPEVPENNLESKTINDVWPIFAREQIELSRELSQAVLAAKKSSDSYSTRRLVAYCITFLLALVVVVLIVPSFTIQVGENFKFNVPRIACGKECEEEKANIKKE